MSTAEEYLQEIKALDRRLQADVTAKKDAKASKALERLVSGVNALHLATSTSLYSQYETEKAFVDGLKARIEQTGTKATTASGEEIVLEISADHRSAKCFSTVAPGSILTTKSGSYLVESFSFSFTGSELALIPGTATVAITKGERPTPYNSHPGALSGSRLTINKKLSQDDTVWVSGVAHRVTASYGTHKHLNSYDLEVVD